MLALQQVESPAVDLAAVGDLMFGRSVAARIQKEGYTAILGAATPELKKADLAFGNLECVLSRRPFTQQKRFLFEGPEDAAPAIKDAGFSLVSVANNHSLDAGPSGLADTVAALNRAHIDRIGDSTDPLVLTRHGVRIAFLAYSDFPTIPGIRYTDEFRLASAIKVARQQADAVVISWHWGNEGIATPSPRQIKLAKLAAGAGADLVLGHHPHVWQPVEWLPGKDGHRCLVAYSLGNFVFDAIPMDQRKTGILHVALSAKGVTGFSITPYEILRGAPTRSSR